MSKLLSWIKLNKFAVFLILVILYLYFNYNGIPVVDTFYSANKYSDRTTSTMPFAEQNVAPTPNIKDRKIVTESNVSLLVKDVRIETDEIELKAQTLGGYIVNTSVSYPEEGANGYVNVRIPAKEIRGFLEFLRKLSVRVVSENISGYDVTDQYVDIQARLDVLNRTKQIYEGMLSKATNIDEILRVQQSIFSVQDQIDNYVGQLKYYDATTSTTLITINLSTDEFSLPYAPSEPWRPNVIFKYAVRSLVSTVRSMFSIAIWIIVYSIIWLPALLVYKFVKIRKKAMQQIHTPTN